MNSKLKETIINPIFRDNPIAVLISVSALRLQLPYSSTEPA